MMFSISEDELDVLDNMDQNDFVSDLLEKVRARKQVDGEPMNLPEEMSFAPNEIPMCKFVITDAQLREYFDAWMYSDKNARRLTELNTIIRDRIISR